jgi:hypothetical protein
MTAYAQGFWSRAPGWRDGDLGEEIVLIERTAKRWKALKLAAALVAALGLVLVGLQMWFGLYAPLIRGGAGAWPRDAEIGLLDGLSGPAGWAGAVVLFAALCIGTYARFMAWWRHG